MELGNFLFGHSFGEYKIERGVGFEEEIKRLFNAYALESDYYEFENDTFSVLPYYWGDCTCGFDDYIFEEKHKNCYQNELEEEKLKNGWIKNENGYLQFTGRGLIKFGDDSKKIYELEGKKEKEIYKKLCKKYNLPLEGCAIHCTCDYYKRYEEWLKKIGYPNEHKPDCLLIKPNFLYKPTKLEIRWYKYPFRDSYSNQPLTLEEFRKIIDDCIKSLNKSFVN